MNMKLIALFFGKILFAGVTADPEFIRKVDARNLHRGGGGGRGGGSGRGGGGRHHGVSSSKSLSVPSDGVLRARLELLPGYTGTLNPRGCVKARFDDSEIFKVSYDLSGLDEADNSCQDCTIEFNEGTSCGALGAAYWDSNDLKSNPWINGYDVLKFGETTGQFMLSNGYNITENIGRTVVIYDNTETPIGCGVLGSKRNRGGL